MTTTSIQQQNVNTFLARHDLHCLLLIYLHSYVAYIANNMVPDQTTKEGV